MLIYKINKKNQDNVYEIYLGILEAVSNFRLAHQEKKVLAILLKHREVTKEVKALLYEITTKQRIENILSNFTKRKFIVDGKVSEKFPDFKTDKIEFVISVNGEK